MPALSTPTSPKTTTLRRSKLPEIFDALKKKFPGTWQSGGSALATRFQKVASSDSVEDAEVVDEIFEEAAEMLSRAVHSAAMENRPLTVTYINLLIKASSLCR